MKDIKKAKLSLLKLEKHCQKYYYTIIFTQSGCSIYVLAIIYKNIESKFVLPGFFKFLKLEDEFKKVLTTNYGFVFGDIL